MAPADKWGEKKEQLFRNTLGNGLRGSLGQGGDCPADGAKLSVIASPCPGAPSELWEEPNHGKNPILKSNDPRGIAVTQIGQRHAPAPFWGTAPHRSIPADAGIWLGAPGFSSSGKKPQPQTNKTKHQTRHSSDLFFQAAAAQFFLNLLFPPLHPLF